MPNRVGGCNEIYKDNSGFIFIAAAVVTGPYILLGPDFLTGMKLYSHLTLLCRYNWMTMQKCIFSKRIRSYVRRY